MHNPLGSPEGDGSYSALGPHHPRKPPTTPEALRTDNSFTPPVNRRDRFTMPNGDGFSSADNFGARRIEVELLQALGNEVDEAFRREDIQKNALIRNGINLNPTIISRMIRGDKYQWTDKNFLSLLRGFLRFDICKDRKEAEYWFQKFCKAKGHEHTSLEEFCYKLGIKGDAFLYELNDKQEPGKSKYTTQQKLSFIGRDDDIEKILTLLQNQQFVAITGTIGVGKSELAYQVVKEAIRKRVFVNEAVININLANEPSTEGAVEGIKKELQRLKQPYTRILLVLDNCEHLKGLPGMLHKLLKEHPQQFITILATSSVSIMTFSDYSIKPLKINDAVKLFLKAAKEINKNSTTSEMDEQKVEELCKRLGGLPLALLLAAALLRYDEFNQVYTWVKENSLLDTEIFFPEEEERHKTTLKILFGRLYKSMGKDEQEGQQLQKLFRRLAIFVAACGIKSVEAVCIIENDLPKGEKLGNLLRSLANHYLITYENGWIEIMHNILRLFAMLELKKKENIEEASKVQSQFIDNYRNLIADYMNQFNNGELEILEYIENLKEKFDNLLHSYRLNIESKLKNILGEKTYEIIRDQLTTYTFEYNPTDFSNAPKEISDNYNNWCDALKQVHEQEQYLITNDPLLALWQEFWIKVMKIDMFNPRESIRYMDYINSHFTLRSVYK